MKKKFTFLIAAVMLLMMMSLPGKAVGQIKGASSYTITFKTGSGDGTSASTSTACSTIVSAGSDYLDGNLVTASSVYYSGSNGLKLGASGSAGVIKMNLSSSGQVTPSSIVVRAKLYNSSKAATISVNGASTQGVTAEWSDFTFNITSAITYLQLNSSKYIWVQSITVISGGPIVLTFDLTSNPGGWPTTNPTTLTNYTYTLDGVNYTFALSNVKCNSGYLMMTKTAVLGLPAIKDYKLTKVVAYNSSGCATSTKVGISSSSSSASYISGGAIQTWSSTSSSYTYNLSGTEANTMYYMYVTSANAQVLRLELTYEYAVATPTFSINGGYYAGNQSVTISCETEGATIYYTTDGSTPSASNGIQGTSVSISATTTLKAIAIKDEDSSPVAEATYTILTPFTTMQAVYEDITSNTALHTIAITFNNWVITGNNSNSSSNPNQFYLTDASNNYGCVISGSGCGFVLGNTLSGTVLCNAERYTINQKAYPLLTNLTIATDGLTVGTGGNVTPNTTTISQLTGSMTGTVIKLENLYYNGNYLADENNNKIVTGNYIYTADLESGKTYNITGVLTWTYSSYGYQHINPRSQADIVEVATASLSVSPAAASPFTYVFGHGPSAGQTFTVTGTHLQSDDITVSITSGGNCFEIVDDDDNNVTVNSGGSVTIRLKAGLAKANNYAGTLRFANEDVATPVDITLSGSVTGEIYDIVLDDQIVGGTIESDLSVAEEGATVTLTSHPAAGYDFTSWAVEDEDENPIEVTNNQFEMPASDVLVTATFTAKPTYGITCAVTPNEAADLEALPASAYEGQTVTLSYIVDNDYYLSSIVITKTSDGTATGITTETSGNDYTFTMPGYAVTVTATFISKTFEGNFVLFTGAMTEGDYILVYNNKAMTNTVTSNKFDVTSVTPSGNVITNPSRNIVWHIAPSATQGYWTIKNEKVNQYANQTGNASGSGSTNVSLVDSPYDGAKWSHVSNSSYDFRSKLNEGQTTVRYLRDNGSGFGTYATENSGSLTLYKYTALTPVTITFNGHGGTYNEATTYTQEVYSGIEATLNSNQFVRSGYGFARWSTEEGGGGITYNDGANITIASNTTLYAQWATAYTASVANDIEGGTVKIIVGGNQLNSYETVAGVEITLSATPSDSYRFSAWNVKDSDNVTITVTDNKFTMPAKNVTISATFEEITTYSLVQSQAQLIPGKHYIIVGSNAAGTNYYAMGEKTSSYMSIVPVTKTNNKIQETDGVCEFVISGDATHGWSFYDKSSGKYLKAVNGNELDQTATLLTDYCYWTIDFEAEAVEFIQSNKYTDRFINFNLTNTRFANYKTSSSMQPVKLYMKDGDTDLELYSETKLSTEVSCTTCSFGNANGKLTIANNGILNCSGTITGATTSNLIIEDGGQLITSSAVNATVKKNITGVGAENWEAESAGWYFIASPVNSSVNPTTIGLITDNDNNNPTYDLYYLDPAAETGWKNYRQNTFNLVNGKGYLYASKTGITPLAIAGTIKPYSTENQANEVNVYSGWNLIGNPFTCNVKPSVSYYVLNDDRDALDPTPKTSSDVIAPCEGIIVKANSNGIVSFTRPSENSSNNQGNVQMVLAQNVTTRGERSCQTMDKAIVSFNEGSQLGKFYFGSQNANLYIPMDNEEYAIVSSSAQGEMPVNFRAYVTGEYTITVNPQEVEMGYLHLIDNIAGVEVDLLANPSYTFNARYDDYESRFRLVFSANMVNTDLNDDFAFFSNGQLVIANEGEAILQVIDVNGRIIATESINDTCSKAINAKAGVYVLRLINGTDVKTQKIIVK